MAPVIDVNAYESMIRTGASPHYTVKHSPQQTGAVIHHEAQVAQWVWPARGPLLTGYSSGNKGIDIGGHYGQPVYAAAAGRVVYAGDGLRGYGNLIIIRHNNEYLSAYAYNSKLFVQEGSWVKTGQKIAEMGSSSSDNAMLHFEIRRRGIPVNPLNILNKI